MLLNNRITRTSFYSTNGMYFKLIFIIFSNCTIKPLIVFWKISLVQWVLNTTSKVVTSKVPSTWTTVWSKSIKKWPRRLDVHKRSPSYFLFNLQNLIPIEVSQVTLLSSNINTYLSTYAHSRSFSTEQVLLFKYFSSYYKFFLYSKNIWFLQTLNFIFINKKFILLSDKKSMTVKSIFLLNIKKI